MDTRYSCRKVALLAVAAGCLIGIAVPALAQDAVKSPEKWRPRDGGYEDTSTECDPDLPSFLVLLRKKLVVGNESFNCKVAKLTDVAGGTIRLDLICGEAELDVDDDPAHVQEYKETMTLRKIDAKSFIMHMTKNGKPDRPERRVRYCGVGPKITPD